MGDATKIYSGPITALGIAAAGTADGGSFTDLGELDEESAANIKWDPYPVGLSTGNAVDKNGKGIGDFVLLQTNAAGSQATLETYKTTLAKLKITTPNTSEYYFIDNVYIHHMKLERNFKAGEVHKLSFQVSLITENPDDFVDGPTSI